MRNPKQLFRQSSIVFEKPGFLSEKLKTLASSNYRRVQYFLLKLHTHFLLTNVYKRVLFRFSVIWKNKKRPGFYTLVFYIFINRSRSKQNKKNSEHFFVDIVNQETCANFQQKILNFVAVAACESFHIFRQIAWFLGNNRAFSELKYCILNNLISIIKL